MMVGYEHSHEILFTRLYIDGVLQFVFLKRTLNQSNRYSFYHISKQKESDRNVY